MVGNLIRSLSILITIFPFVANSQQQVSLEHLTQRLMVSGDGDLMISDLEISISNNKLKRNKGVFNYISENYSQYINNESLIIINRRVILDNLAFSDHLYLNQFDFKGGLEIRNSQFNGLTIDGVHGHDLIFFGNGASNIVEVLNAKFERVELVQNNIDYGLILDKLAGSQLKVENNRVNRGEIDVLASKLADGNLLIGDNDAQEL